MRISLVLFLCFVAFPVLAQQKAILLEKTANDSISIHADINNAGASYTIDTILLKGNKVTRPHIILHELTFASGDTIGASFLANKLRKSRENLLNTSLFNFVTITDSIVNRQNPAGLVIIISFVERWYIWPFPIFEISDRNLNSWWENKDFDRINYGFFLTRENCRGRMETLRLLLRFGYDERYEISYNLPYINKSQTFGAGFGFGWTQNHEVAYQTTNNKLDFVKDEDEYLFKNTYSYFQISHRPSLYHRHQLRLFYTYLSFGDTVLALNPDYSFGGEAINEYISLDYSYISDHRDSKAYPLRGEFFSGSLTKSGFGIMKNGDISMMELSGSYRKYWKLSPLFFVSTDWAGKISTVRDQAYFYQQGLGYNRLFVRGYELYVVDGHSFLLSKNNLKFNLLPTQVAELKFINFERFTKIHYALYLNWFIDAGYVDSSKNRNTNDLANTLLLSTGLGLDLVTYYDMVFRVEASINRLGEPGVFIHFKNTL